MAKKMIGLRCKNFRADTLQLKRLYKKFVTISEDALLQRNGEIDLHLYNVVGDDFADESSHKTKICTEADIGNIPLSCLLIAECKQCLLFYARQDLS